MSILAKFDGFDFPIRESDGYWNLTRMCDRYGQRIDNFMRLKGTKDFLRSLERSLRCEGASKLNRGKDSARSEGAIKSYYSEIGGSGGGGATWGHPQLALKLAAWLNPDFEVWVYATIEKLFREGQVTLSDELDSLRQALGDLQEEFDEMLISRETSLLRAQRLQDSVNWYRQKSRPTDSENPVTDYDE